MMKTLGRLPQYSAERFKRLPEYPGNNAAEIGVAYKFQGIVIVKDGERESHFHTVKQ